MIIHALIALQVKHFICDFPLQAFPYQYKNKGTYGHLGGILHSAVHAIGTFCVFIFIASSLAVALAIADFIIHYHIDWAKMKINSHFKLKPDNSEYFWILLGIDQFFHQLTYIGFICLI